MKKTILVLTIIFLSGCISTPGAQTQANEKKIDISTNETILRQTKNYPKLLVLYKNKLKEKENSETRIKLAETYLMIGDPESTIFYLSPIINSSADADPDKTAVYYLQAKAQYDLGLVDDAIVTADELLTINANHAETLNLMGILYADKNNFKQAREYFNQARLNFYDDLKVKNNIAILDIIEQDYQSAVSSLYPLYLNGQTDEQVNATLLIALSKMGNYPYVKSMLSSKYKEDDIMKLFKALRSLESVSASNKLSDIDLPLAKEAQ